MWNVQARSEMLRARLMKIKLAEASTETSQDGLPDTDQLGAPYMDNTSDIQVISDQSKIPFADVDPKLQSATDKSSDILEKFVIAENEDDLVKAYQMAEEKLVCILLELDAHPTDDTGDRKQAVDYVLHCTKLLDQRAQRKAKDKLHEIERKLQDGTSTADCAERLQRRRDDLRKLLRSLKDDSTETPVGDGNEMNVPSAKSTSPEENIEEGPLHLSITALGSFTCVGVALLKHGTSI
ncbi:hypothetical protein Bbelb_024480 [Branchiostoma belcheri]|nr:hypothetical protein Bbelb_024480 [Branchiostoma belcheri]